MFESGHVFCLYNYLKLSHGEVKDSISSGHYYYILYFLDNSGVVEREVIEKLYQDYYKKPLDCGKRYVGPFSDLDDLGNFAIKVCQKIGANKINIHSCEEFSIHAGECTDIESLGNVLLSKANHLENSADSPTKNSFFSKLFR